MLVTVSALVAAPNGTFRRRTDIEAIPRAAAAVSLPG